MTGPLRIMIIEEQATPLVDLSNILPHTVNNALMTIVCSSIS